jgi:SAM-dependent methyltransferase
MVQGEQTIRCERCGEAWPVIEGVPNFISEAPYWGEIDQDRMIEINERIRNRPWRNVLMEDSSEQVMKAAKMMMNPDRANWHMLLPLGKESIVLDIGAGSGAITETMASSYHHVIAVEPVKERITFMQERFRQDGLHNVTLIRSGVTKLPLLPRSVDLAILNGVLEWIPWSVEEGNPRDIQIQALRRLYDLLRPGGFLCVGIENRWNLGYFAGGNDPHADIPYVTILPRFLADWYARRKTGRPYRNYLYSAFGYRKLFRAAGFSDAQVYCAIPSYNYPSFIVPFDRPTYSYYQRQFNTYETSRKRRLVLGLLRAFGLDKHLVYSFFIIGRKGLEDA